MLLRKLGIRIIFGFFTLFLISVLVFVATNILPGDAARSILGRAATDEAVAALQAKLGLDQPLFAQFSGWITGLIQGNFGQSLITNGPVWDFINTRLVNSLTLLVASAVIAIPLSFLIGTLMAIRSGRAFDTLMNGFLLTLAGIPEFVIGIVLVLLLSTQVFHLLPPTALVPPGEMAWQNPSVLILPVLTLSCAVLPYLGRLVRAALMDALVSEYVVMARLKGLSPRVVLLRHAMRNSLIASIQASGLTLAYILGGAVIVEFIFQYPGLGSALQSAVASRDIYVIQSIVLIFSTGYIIFNMAADILTILLTPRLRG